MKSNMDETSKCEIFERDPKTAQMGKEIFPFEMGYLPEFFKRKAEVELGDTPENRQKGLKVLKELIANDKSFNSLSLDDEYLLQYLICEKFNTKKAFRKLKAYANLRENHKSLFQDFNFGYAARSMKNKIISILPYRCQDGCGIGLLKLDNWVPEEFPVEEFRRTIVIFLLQSLRDPMTQVNGIKIIFDVKNNPFRYIRYATPKNLYLMYHGTQECSPGRFKGFHVVNMSSALQAVWAIFRLFMSSKLKSRVYFHDKPEGLLDYFPAAVLPVEYGGDLTDYDLTEWCSDVMSPEKLSTLGGIKHSNS